MSRIVSIVGKKKIPFDLEKVRVLGRNSSKSKEFNAQTWDQIDFQDKINGLVTKGLVEQLENKKYQISKLGIDRYVK